MDCIILYLEHNLVLGMSKTVEYTKELAMQANQKNIVKESWWLMYCCFPNLLWARIQVYSDSSAEVLDSDGSKFKCPKEEEAQYFLLEDEHTSLKNLDEEDEQELGILLNGIEIPRGKNDEELIGKMYIKHQG